MEDTANVLAEVVQVSAHSTGADSLLSRGEVQTVWVSGEGFPQVLVFGLARVRPGVVKCFGWRCVKAFRTNPALVEVAASVDGRVYEVLGSLQGRELAAPQYFPIQPLYLRFNYLRMTILKAFGANKTALSQVFLLEEVPQMRSSPETDLKTLLSQLPRSQSQHHRPPLPSPSPLPPAKDSESGELASLRDTLKSLSAQVKALQAEVNRSDSKHSPRFPSAAGVSEFLRNWQDTVLEPRLQRFEQRMLELLAPVAGPRHRGVVDRYRDAASALY